MDRLCYTCHFIHRPLHVLSCCAATEEAEASIAETSKVHDETGREQYIGAGDRERVDSDREGIML